MIAQSLAEVPEFPTWSYKTDQPMSLEAVRQVAKKLPGGIYWCKGVVFAVEAPERRVVLQVVGRRSDVSLYDEWGDSQPLTQIVAIGAPGGIDGEDLTAKLDACRAFYVLIKVETSYP